MSRTAVLVCLWLLLVTSCTREIEISCARASSISKTYVSILNSLGVQARTNEGQRGTCVSVPRRDMSYASGVIAKLQVYTQDHPGDDVTLIKQFVPVLQSARDKINSEISKVRDTIGVLKIICDTQSQMNCSIWYHAKVVSEAELKSLLPLVLRPGSVFNDVQKELNEYVVQAAQNLTHGTQVVVLEPFTFHVPIPEKDIAGIQLILVLGVFLLSGFVIGFWFGSKDRRMNNEK